MGYKVLNKNKEVTAATATSKKGRDTMLVLQKVLSNLASFCIIELAKIALKSIK